MTDTPSRSSPWTMARRAARMNPSVIREILKVTERAGIISFAGGLPSAKTFPVAEFEAACAKVLRDDSKAALQYAASEGFGPLREMVAANLPWPVDPAQVMITTGSQQGLDLVAKVLLDTGSRVLVEASPTDRIWGIGLASNDIRAQSPAKWRGQNLLGFALMEARQALAAV